MTVINQFLASDLWLMAYCRRFIKQGQTNPRYQKQRIQTMFSNAANIRIDYGYVPKFTISAENV